MPIASDEQLAQLLTSVGTIAMVGASDNPARASHGVMQFLQNHGYRVIPVNPGLAGQTLLGQMVAGSLSDIAEPIDMVDIFRNSDAAGAVVDEAMAVGAKAVWMQLGVVNQDAAGRAEAAGLQVVMDRCPKIEIARLRVPHRR
jgi:uncharacterized protein